MKKKIGTKNWTLLMGILLITGGLSVFPFGCSSKSSKATPFQIVFCSLYVNENAVSEYGAFLQNKMPELIIEGKAPVFTPMIMGEVKNDIEAGIINDPMMGMGGIIKMTTMVSTNEIDLMISDMENAARQARGDMFKPLEEVFTDDEISALKDRLLSFEILNVEGYEPTPTGEKTPVCGINITGNENMKKIFGDQEVGIFILANAKNLELAKDVIRSLL